MGAGTDNHLCYDEHGDVQDGVANGGQGSNSSGEHGPGSNGSSVNLNNGCSGLQIAQQPVGGGIRWEKFLPLRSLKVLLVENDDSTRHVVSALLRNCSYEVMAASSEIEAWSVLQDQSNHIDLVLAEVGMPLLSGIGLLCKITSHKKNIPVIMMSSHDSMGIVFKCLSKGAADFLVKPIRKNELKNLWMHVWRRCQSSSVSGNESGTQTKRSTKPRSSDDSETNTYSSDEHDNGSNGLSYRDGSDDGSGTQSSWTKIAPDVDSPQPQSPQKLAAPNRSCAQVIHLMPGSDAKRWVCETETKDYQEQYEHDHAALGIDLKIGPSGNPDSECEYQSEKETVYSVCKRQNNLLELESNPLDVDDKLKNSSSKSRGFASSASQKTESRVISTSNGFAAISHVKDRTRCDTEDTPSLELTLKRIRGVDGGTAGPDEDNVLRHSDLSAFSKYNTASSSLQIPTGNVETCSPLVNNSVGMKMEEMQNYLSHSSGTLNPRCNGVRNGDVASSTIFPSKAEAFTEISESISAFRSSHTSAFQPLNSGNSSLQAGTTGGTGDVIGNTPKSQLRSPYHKVQIQHHHHHHHHYHHHVHRVKQHQPQCDEKSLQKMAEASPQCGSSNAAAEPTEGNSGNCSVNGSISGSNHGSNGQNESATILNARVENTESDHGATGSKGAGSTSGRITGNGADDDRVVLREAALAKFRQKRKERCFEKKVRYQGRKRLAEQRPRVKGQFVRQIMSDNSAVKDENQSNDLVSEDNSRDSLQ